MSDGFHNKLFKYFSQYFSFRISFTLIALILILVMTCFHTTSVSAQKKTINPTDTVIFVKHSPHKATVYSMVLPGLGQAYNKKYWKIPIVYAGFGIFTYFIITNRQEYVKYRDAYDYVTRGDSLRPIDNEYIYKYDADQLSSGRDFYRRNLEFTYILTGVWYLLNVLDAAVDAHLFDYDISNDLSIRLNPVNNYNFVQPSVTPGITLSWKLK